jgi:hypothetical protein
MHVECTIPIATDNIKPNDQLEDEMVDETISSYERRILLSLQCFFSPWLLLLMNPDISIFLPLVVSLALTMVMWSASRRHLTKLDIHLASLGCEFTFLIKLVMVSIAWIYVIANCIVVVLQVLVKRRRF